jgi:hypothetical protein
VSFGDIRNLLGKDVALSQWHLLLDPIYEEEKIKRGRADTFPASWWIRMEIRPISAMAARRGVFGSPDH